MIDKQNTYLADTSLGYDFHPKLFGLINLDVHAGFGSVDAIIILAIALLAAMVQYFTMKNQMPNKGGKTIRQLMKEAADGKDVDQSEINAASTAQMSKIMPIMMLFVMLQLPGALVFYYLLINAINAVQQKIIFAKSEDEMEASADKSVVRELNKIKEAEIIKNKKTGTKITRITAKDLKKSSKKKRSNK